MTYNVWFEDHRFGQRALALFHEMKAANADVIAMQEVTKEFLTLLLQQDWVRSSYFSSDADGHTLGSYGVLLLVKKAGLVVTVGGLLTPLRLESFSLHALPTCMDRQLLCAHLVSDPGASSHTEVLELLVGTVHLESLDSTSMREKQLTLISKILAGSSVRAAQPLPSGGAGGGARLALATQHRTKGWMLVGDFNFSDGWKEEKLLSKLGVDLWRVLYPDKPGHTMPKNSRFEAWRPDRVVVQPRSSSSSSSKTSAVLPLRALEVQVVGTAVLDAHCKECGAQRRASGCNPSDHFGLVARLALCYDGTV